MRKITSFLAAFFISAIIIFSGSPFAQAEVPGHNPDLDSKCSPGFQWSQSTVACEQANCPPGAGRTYTLECSCGEAWDKPFKTCYDVSGLAAYCIGKDQECENVRGGFDPFTGECKLLEGFEWNSDKTDCVQLYPSRFTCKIQDPQGNPVSGKEITFGEYTSNLAAPDTSSKITPNAAGEVELSVQNREAKAIKIAFPGGDGYYRTIQEISPFESHGGCVLTVYTNEQVEQWVKDQYTDFLKNACLSEDLVKKISEAEFEFDADVDVSQYDAQSKKMKISSGDMGSDFDTLSRAILHEFGHYISDAIIDPTGVYVKGYPFWGKYVGGAHNNWEPHEYTANWGPDIDPEQNAYEEALADFLATMYFASKGEVYQSDLQDGKTAHEVLKKVGKDKATRVEGAIASFLIEYYKDQAQSGPDGPARAVGDFIRAETYDRRHAWTRFTGYPSRTVTEFITSKVKSDKKDPKNECSPAQTPDIAKLAEDYGFTGSNKAKIKMQPGTPEEKEKAQNAISGMDFGNVDPETLHNLIPIPNQSYTFPPGTAPTVEVLPKDFAKDGKVGRVTFNPEITNIFSVDPNSVVTIEEGEGVVEDADVQTPDIFIVHKNTAYVVSVKDGKTEIKALEGSVEAQERGGEGRTMTIMEGEGTAYTPEKGFGQPAEVSMEELERGVQAPESEGLRNGIFALIAILVIAGAVFFWKKKKKK